MDLLIGVALFVAVVFIVAGVILLLKSKKDLLSERIKKHRVTTSAIPWITQAVDITKKRRKLSDIPWLDRLFQAIPFFVKLDRVLVQSNVKYPLGVFILMTLILGFVGYGVSSLSMKGSLMSIPAALCAGMIPFFYIIQKKNMRMKKFERQLPDALDLFARSLRAGHAFSGGLQMVAQEFDDPLGSEFAKVIDEVNFGVGIKEALINLTERVDCENLKFFAMSVTLQRETGGDLAEILENIARLIRERFKLQARIRALMAEGKLSVIILIALPFFIGFGFAIVSPDYLTVLITDPLGKLLVLTSFVMMVLGVVVMKKIVAIKV
ncbi:MAG: type II secretion system F family protein [Candidatus Brocadiaceae bacterium]